MKVRKAAEKGLKQTNRSVKTFICINPNKRSQSNSCKIVQHNFVEMHLICVAHVQVLNVEIIVEKLDIHQILATTIPCPLKVQYVRILD